MTLAPGCSTMYLTSSAAPDLLLWVGTMPLPARYRLFGESTDIQRIGPGPISSAPTMYLALCLICWATPDFRVSSNFLLSLKTGMVGVQSILYFLDISLPYRVATPIPITGF